MANNNCKDSYSIAPYILNRNFKVDRENQVWVFDITLGWMYMTMDIDLFHRKVIEWIFSNNLSANNTIIPVWKMAMSQMTISKELIFHSEMDVHLLK